MSTDRFRKIVVFVNALVPLALLSFDAWQGNLGANPVEFFLRTTGVLALIFLLLTLAVTPVRILTGINEAVRLRRMLGLFVAFYACVHLLTYSVFDKSGSLGAIAADVRQRPFIALGMTAFLLLVPLAATSTNGMVRRIGGRRWALLHRLTYAAAVFGTVHFWMIVKSDIFWPAVFASVLALLFAVRIGAAVRRARKRQRS